MFEHVECGVIVSLRKDLSCEIWSDSAGRVGRADSGAECSVVQHRVLVWSVSCLS